MACPEIGVKWLLFSVLVRAKDQTIGVLILAVWVVVPVGYVVGLFLCEPLVKPWLNIGAATNAQF